MSVTITISGIILLSYALLIFSKSNFTLGVLLTFCIALGVLLLGLFKKPIKELTAQGVFRWIKYIIISLLIFQFSLIGFLAIYGQNDTVNYKEDAIIVLGAGVHGDKVSLPLKYRLDKAIEYTINNPKAYIVVTGGKGYQESVTEAYAMKKYLTQHGVDEKLILMEEKATSTIENMEFSREILENVLGENYKTVVITNDFHIYRGVYYAEKAGFKDVTHLGANLNWYSYVPCYLRESLAVLKMFVFD